MSIFKPFLVLNSSNFGRVSGWFLMLKTSRLAGSDDWPFEMKQVYFGLVFLFASLSAFGQTYGDAVYKQKFTKADALIFDGDYLAALPILEELQAADTSIANINYMIGVCHLFGSKKYLQAVRYLENASRDVSKDYSEANWKEKKAPGITYLQLGRAYHQLNDFERAVGNYYNYRSFIDIDDVETYNKVRLVIKHAENAMELVKKPVNVKITNLGQSINTIFPDYAPVISSDGETLIFTSRRPGGASDAKDKDGSYFDDIYISKRKGVGAWGKPAGIGATVNTIGHEAAIGFAPDGQTLFIYKDDKGDGNIYFSELKNGEWSSPVKMGSDINSTAWETHATVSSNSDLLIFTSNRAGGYGGRDLWYCVRLPDGAWSLAQNMGSVVNSQFEEEAPFLAFDGKTLFFSSQGHTSMGGFDVFRSELIEGNWTEPENLGYPINTSDDNTFFVLSADGKTAYYSSRHDGGFGETDIYTLLLESKKAEAVAVARGRMLVPANEYVKLKASIVVKNSLGVEVGSYRPNPNSGYFVLILNPGESYDVQFKVDGYDAIGEKLTVSKDAAYVETFKPVDVKDVVFGSELLALQEKKRQDEMAAKLALEKALMDLKLAEEANQQLLAEEKNRENLEAIENANRLEVEKANAQAKAEASRAEQLLLEAQEREIAAKAALDLVEKQNLAEKDRLRNELEAKARAKAQETARLAAIEKAKQDEVVVEENRAKVAAEKLKLEQEVAVKAVQEAEHNAQEEQIISDADKLKIANEAKVKAEAEKLRLDQETERIAQEEQVKADEDKLRVDNETQVKAEADKLRIEQEEYRIVEEHQANAAAEKLRVETEAARMAEMNEKANADKLRNTNESQVKAEAEKVRNEEEAARVAGDEQANTAAEKLKTDSKAIVKAGQVDVLLGGDSLTRLTSVNKTDSVGFQGSTIAKVDSSVSGQNAVTTNVASNYDSQAVIEAKKREELKKKLEELKQRKLLMEAQLSEERAFAIKKLEEERQAELQRQKNESVSEKNKPTASSDINLSPDGGVQTSDNLDDELIEEKGVTKDNEDSIDGQVENTNTSEMPISEDELAALRFQENKLANEQNDSILLEEQRLANDMIKADLLLNAQKEENQRKQEELKVKELESERLLAESLAAKEKAIQESRRLELEQIEIQRRKDELEAKEVEVEKMRAEQLALQEKIRLDDEAKRLEQIRIEEEKQVNALKEKQRLDELAEQEARKNVNPIGNVTNPEATSIQNSESEKVLSELDIQNLVAANQRLTLENIEMRNQLSVMSDKLEAILLELKGLSVNGSKESPFNADVVSALKSGKQLILQNILFDYNKARLRGNSELELDKLRDFLLENPKIRIQVSGHTDAVGDESYNLRLSRARAEAVVDYLVSKGVSSNRLKAVGFGQTKPIARNINKDGSDNPLGRQLNRRIEISTLDGDSSLIQTEELIVPEDARLRP
jgi:outer membrane protein OmpA-like peptidoglycan-associated protein